MKKTRRSSQVGDIVRDTISSLLRRELADPSYGLVTITDVEMTPDLKLAKVFVSTLGDEKDIHRVAGELQQNVARIRFLVGQRAKLRHTPELVFKGDTTGIRASAIDRALREALPPKEAEPEGGGNDSD